jgi:FtsP/CotA-like multicopper oxidase with cupredoxin domain
MRRGPLGTLPVVASHHARGTFNHAVDGMGGLVMGVVVSPKQGYVPPVYAAESQRRQLRLVVRPSAQGGGRADAPSFEYALEDGTTPVPAARHDHVAPPIVLTRGEPVTITVVNALGEPTSVHWHGIELESYYDGVAGFSGTARRLSPVIAPRDSFVARFTPPRHGTFIYHTHIDEGRQQPAGLAGPIIVLEPDERFDPRTDLTVVASSIKPPSDTSGAIPQTILLNGSQTSPPLLLRVGVRSRVRLINMTTNDPGLRFDLMREGTLQHWRPLAKDGADLPEGQRTVRDARQSVSIGETADVEIVPEREGAQTLEAHLSTGALIGTLAVQVGP